MSLKMHTKISTVLLLLLFSFNDLKVTAQIYLLSEGFENTVFPPTGWGRLNGGTGNNWNTFIDGSAHTGTKAAEYKYYTSSAGNAWLISPGLSLTAGTTYTITFWERTSTSTYPEKLKLTVGASQTIAAQTTLIQDYGSHTTNDIYVQRSATYTPVSSGTFYFAWNCYSAANQYFLDIDDISITAPAPPCSGQPTGGTTSATVTSGCTNFSSVLSVTGASNNSGITYQWESSPTGTAPWTIVPGATGDTYTTTVASTTYYRRKTTCSSSSLYDYSSIVQLTPMPCLNMSNNTVTACSGIFYDSGGITGNYSDNSNLTMTICATAGMYPRIEFTEFETEFATSANTDWLKIYDGNSTASPLVGAYYTSPNSSNVPGTITGNNTCLTYQFHSDGSVNKAGWSAQISCVPLCTGSPAGGTGNADYNVLCSGDTTLLSVSGSPSDQGITYQWESSPTGNTPWTAIAGATGATFYARITSNMYFRRKITCANGNLFEYCTPVYLTYDVNCGAVPCVDNPPAADDFSDATSICNLNGYCGNTSASYTDDEPGNITESSTLFPATIENNSWLSFVASDVQSVLRINVSNCTHLPGEGNGIQMRIYGTDDGGTTFVAYSNFIESVTNHATIIATGLTVGETYYLMIDGQNGDHCDYSISATSGVAASTVDAGNDTTICQGQSVQLNVVGGSTYQWSPSTGLSNPNIANPIATPSTTTTYTVSVSGGIAACATSSVDSVKITVGSLTSIASNNGPLCIGATLSLNTTPNGGSYQWSGPNGFTSNVQNPVISAVALADSGMYSVTVSLPEGCIGTAQTNVSVTASANASIVNNSGTNQLTCLTPTIDVTASGGSSYFWSGGTSTTTANNSFTSPGIYTVTVSTAGSCTSTASIIITQDASVINAGITNNSSGAILLTCNLTSIHVTATPNGATSYLWSGGSSLNTDTNTFNTPGLYTVTVTAANGCTDTESINITQNDSAPTAGIVNNSGGSTELNCLVSSINASATPAGAASYLWSGGSSTNAATNSFSVPGTYTVTVTATNGCTDTESINITQNTTPPTAGIANNSGGATELNCLVSTINATAMPAGAASYHWSGGSSPNTAANSFTTPGSYTVTVTAANGCTDTESITITQNASTITAGIVNNSGVSSLSCNTSYIKVTATPGGAASYLWSGGSSIFTDTNTFNAPGLYTVTVTIANGCSDTESISISQEEPLHLEVESIIPDHCNQGMGEATIIATGGSGNYAFTWDGTPQGPTINNLLAGTYQVIVSDGSCTASIPVVVGNIPGPIAAFDLVPPTGSRSNPVFRFLNESTNANAYSWSFGDGNFSTTESPTHHYPEESEENQYTVILKVTDNFGCTDTISHAVIITEDLNLWIPNAFTPDEDGVNDIFKPSGIGYSLDGYEMTIYDRWGKLLFVSNEFERGWDGKVDGTVLNINDVFIYTIVIYDLRGQNHQFTGHVTLLGSKASGNQP